MIHNTDYNICLWPVDLVEIKTNIHIEKLSQAVRPDLFINPVLTGGCTVSGSFAILLFSLLLQIALFKEQPCAIFSLIALYKRVTVSKLLSSLFKKSDVSDLLFCSQKTSDSLKKMCVFTMFLKDFHCFSPFYTESLPSLFALSLFFKERQEQYALIALF